MRTVKKWRKKANVMSVERGREKAEKSYPISRIQLPNGAGDNV